jgi:hypothetical protein
LQPHLCLHGEEGLQVLQNIIAAGEKANTEFSFLCLPVASGSDFWLNIYFWVFLNGRCQPTNCVQLTPQQTSFIIRNLSEEWQKEVLAKAKAWYVEYLRGELLKGIDTITAQFEGGDPLLQSDHDNRIFDIHNATGVRAEYNIPYTESEIAGEHLFWPFHTGFTLFDHGSDGYARMDEFLAAIIRRRKGAVDGAMTLLRGLSDL